MRFLGSLTAFWLLLGSVDGQFQLTLLHINDHHSHLASDTFGIDMADLPAGVTLPGDADEVDVSYGGFPLLVSLFDSLVQSETNVVKVHAGDMLAGTLFFTIFEGEADAAMMNRVCFDYAALGNHEFDNGDQVLAGFIADLQSSTDCPATRILSANVEPAAGTPIDGLVEDYEILEIGGEQVAFIGATTDVTVITSSPLATTDFTDVVTAVTAAVDEVTALGVNKVVVVSHVGYGDDVGLLAGIPNVDVVVGGHTHDLLGEASQVSLLKAPTGPFPTAVTRMNDSGTVCVVQAWEYGHGLGMLSVEFDDMGDVAACGGGPKFPFDPMPASFDPALDDASATALTAYLEGLGAFVALTPDAGTATELGVFAEAVTEGGSEVIATVPLPGICYERIPGQGRSLICTAEETLSQGGGVCNLVAQGFLDQAFSADVAIQNGGGCRTDIFAGNFTVNDAFELLPFRNTLVTLDMTGAEIITVLNQAMESAATDVSTGAYPYAAGLRYDVDFNAGPDYISNVEVNIRLEASWVALDESATYTVVTNDFIASGRDGYLEFAAIEDSLVTDLFLEYANTFVAYSREVGTLVDPPLETYSTKSFVELTVVETDPPAAAPVAPTAAPVAPTAAPVAPTEAPAPTSAASAVGRSLLAFSALATSLFFT